MTQSETPTQLGTRISVVGTTGSGKTTTALALSRRLGLRHVELDALSWGPGWTLAPLEELRAAVAREAAGDRWVIDGNYGTCRDLVWARADTIVWLDFPFASVFRQLLGRTLRRAFRHERLWSGNRESLRRSLLSRDSILWWAIKTHRRRQREYGALLAQPAQALVVVRLRSPREARRWLAGVRAAGDANPDATSGR